MSYEAIARRWARAIFELGKEANKVTELNRETESFAETFTGSAELAEVLDNPLVPEAAREAIVEDVATRLGFSEVTRSTLRLLARKRRLKAVPEIARQLARLVDEDANIMRAHVTSAGPLTDDYLSKLRAELEKATSKRVVIVHEQDPSLIAGVITRLGDQVIDGSVRARLASFRETLLRT